MKIGLVKILKDFRLEKTAKTLENIVLNQKSVLFKADKGVDDLSIVCWLKK